MKAKGVFILSFLNLGIEPNLTKEEMNELTEKLKPIVKEADCDIIIMDRIVMPIDKKGFIKSLKGIVRFLE